LQHAGVLEAVGGVVLGTFTTGPMDAETPSLSLSEVFQDYFGDRSYPVVKGLPYGHHLPRCSLPLGVPVHLHATGETATLTAQGPLVRP
jgi:muramoyltetrapeptide carboxypeptidase